MLFALTDDLQFYGIEVSLRNILILVISLVCENDPMYDMVLKLSQYIYLLVEKPFGCYFQVWSPYHQTAQCNQKTPITVFLTH